MGINIRVFYFAHLREKRGKDEEKLEVEEGCSARSLLHHIFRDNVSENHLRVAINNEYSNMDTILSNGDEVVFLPPVAGG